MIHSVLRVVSCLLRNFLGILCIILLVLVFAILDKDGEKGKFAPFYKMFN